MVQSQEITCSQEYSLRRELHHFAQSGVHIQDRIVFYLFIRGDLDLGSLNRSLNELVTHYEAFQIGFVPRVEASIVTVQGWQQSADCLRRLNMERTAENIKFKVKRVRGDHRAADYHYVSSASESARWAEIETIVASLRSQQFDYGAPPLMRAAVLKVSQHEHILVVLCSHLIFDGWSKRIFVRDLRSAYRKRPNSKVLGTAPATQSEFATFERQLLADPQMRQELQSYCERRMTTMPLNALELSQQQSVKRGQHFATASYICDLDNRTTGQVRRALGVFKCSAFMFLLSALAIAMHTVSKVNIVGIWVFLANRRLQKFQETVGWLSNNHLICIPIEYSMRATAFIMTVRSLMCDAMDHQEVPFEMILRSLSRFVSRPIGDLGVKHRIIFDQAIAVQPDDPSEMVTFEGIRPEVATVGNYCMKLVLYPQECIRLRAHYCSDCFEAGLIEDIMRRTIDVLMELSTANDTALESIVEKCRTRQST